MFFRIVDIVTYKELLQMGAHNYCDAATRAARRLFAKEKAQRETGSVNKPGMFIAFNDGDEGTVAFRVEEVK